MESVDTWTKRAVPSPVAVLMFITPLQEAAEPASDTGTVEPAAVIKESDGVEAAGSSRVITTVQVPLDMGEGGLMTTEAAGPAV